MSDESRWGRLAHMVRDLDPGSRALLDLSVRRGLGDVEIAGVLGTDPTYVTNTRTGVIRTMAADLQLGDEIAELEHALAQLPPDAWLPASSGANGAVAEAEGAAVAAPTEDLEGEPEPSAEIEEPEEPEAALVEDAEAVEETVEEPEDEPGEEIDEEGAEPADADDQAPADDEETPSAVSEDEPEDRRERPQRHNLGALVTATAIVLLGATLVIVFALSGGSDEDDGADRPAGEQSAERERPAEERGRERGPREEPALERRELTSLPGLAAGAEGSAALDGERVVLRVSGLPRGSYQVWLYDSLIESKALGRLRRDGRVLRGRFDGADLKDYRWLDVSREPRDGNPNHSGRSVLRIATGELR